jgi:steroid 5-alpha reductase family enzyme
MSPLTVAFVACGAVIAVCWLASVVTSECSWVDRLWSIMPIAYVVWFAAQTGFSDPRLAVMAALVAAWGIRLTFNFARKGGFRKGGEDYRWAALRARMPPWAYQIFNLLFIAGYQNLLVLLFTLPAWAALAPGAGLFGIAATDPSLAPTPFGALDAVATVLFVVFLVGETIADQQQWVFQTAKRQRQARGELVGPGFVTTGLFRFSRHPNFFCEQAIWWSFYLFSVGAGAGLVNATIIGPVLLSLLFHGSTRFTEAITLSRYPAYADYQRSTSRLVPWFPGTGTMTGAEPNQGAA